MRKIKNYCEFVIKGLNQERFFNDLASLCFVFDINRYERNKTSFKVSIKFFRAVKKKILSSGFEILGESKKGHLYKLLNFRYAYGLMAGIVTSLAVFFIQLPFVWRITICGVNEEIKTDISNYITNNFQMKKSSLNCKEIEIALRDNFENLSFASVALEGQTLVINAKEGETPTEKDNNFEAIVAPYDCRILRVKLIQGTLAVEAGDTVRKGESIVLPYILDTHGQEKSVEPKAEIEAQTWLVGEASHADEEVVTRRTGNSYAQEELYLYNAKIYSHCPSTKYSDYEVEESQRYFSKNNILPLVFVKKIYYELETITVKQRYDEVREEKITLAREKALQNIQECDIITEERYVENLLDGFANITYYITIERTIEFK